MVDLNKVLFFNVALKDGHIMSRPKFEPQQEFVATLVHEIETFDPEFAWIQFVFVLKDYTRELTSLKVRLYNFKRSADTPVKKRTKDGKEYAVESRERASEWYRTVEARTKNIEEARSSAKVLMGIQGMWVNRESHDTDGVPLNTFNKCKDEIDSLAIFTYNDPRMLEELVSRRIVTDLAKYFVTYHRSRAESPSLILTPDELPYFIHLPSGGSVGKLTSFVPGVAADAPVENDPFIPAMEIIPGEPDRREVGLPAVSSLKTVPNVAEPLKENDVSRLQNIASTTTRSFEIMYDDSRTNFLVSSRKQHDLQLVKKQLLFLYPGTEFACVTPIPKYIEALAKNK
jgi:hypothetical protein